MATTATDRNKITVIYESIVTFRNEIHDTIINLRSYIMWGFKTSHKCNVCNWLAEHLISLFLNIFFQIIVSIKLYSSNFHDMGWSIVPVCIKVLHEN